MRGVLFPDCVYDHALWKLPAFVEARQHLVLEQQYSEDLLRVFIVTLRTKEALAPMDIPEPAPVSDAQLSALTTWLPSRGAFTAFEEVWEKTWCAGVHAAREASANTAFDGVAAVVDQCIEGKFAGVDPKMVRSMVLKARATEELKAFCYDFARGAEALTKVVGAGSLVPPGKLNMALGLFADLESRWPSGDALDEDCVKCGFGKQGALEFVKTSLTTLQTKWRAEVVKRTAALSTSTVVAVEKLGKVPTDTEAKFRAHMKSGGAALTKEQAALGQAIANMTAIVPAPEEVLKGLAASLALVYHEAKRKLAAANGVHAKIFNYTCAYVALTLYRHPVTTKMDEEGAAQKSKLISCLKQMPTDESSSEITGSESWYPTVLAAMRQVVENAPSAASGAQQPGVSAAAVPTGGAQEKRGASGGAEEAASGKKRRRKK